MGILMTAGKTMDQEITNYLPHLSNIQKQAVLNVIKTFAAEQQDWWNKISEEQQLGIDKALAEMKAGKLTTHEEVLKKYKKWVKK